MTSPASAQPEVKKKASPNTIVLILFIILVTCLLTWIIPAGKYVRITDAAGHKIIDPNKFSYIARSPVSPLVIPIHIVKGFISSVKLFIAILFSGGAFQLINKSGALHSIIASLVKKFSNKLHIFIPVLSFAFTLICTVKGVNTFIPFAPILVFVAKAMGLDSIVGVAIILLGGAVGFSTGTLNTSTTIVAQNLSGLPAYSGIGYRAFCLVVFSIVTNIYLVRYALKIKKEPTCSPMYDLDHSEGNVVDQHSLDEFGPMTGQKWLTLLTMFGTLGVIVGGSMFAHWSLVEMDAGYLWMAFLIAIILRLSPGEAVQEFFKGMRTMLFAASIICVARAVSSILTAGKIIDTIIYAMSLVLQVVPTYLLGPVMYFVNVIINILITSGSGQAVVVIPIMAPLADMVGITRQTAILSFNFGDGFCNYILPTSSALMGILSVGKVPYDRWMKFMWKLFLIWLFTGSILMIGAQLIHLA